MIDVALGDGGNEGIGDFRLPPIGLGKCMVPSNGNGCTSDGCRQCVLTHHDEIARVSEPGDKYVLNDCARYQTVEGWKIPIDILRMVVNNLQSMPMDKNERRVFDAKRDFLSVCDTAHKRGIYIGSQV